MSKQPEFPTEPVKVEAELSRLSLLISPLRAIVRGYLEPTVSEEFAWKLLSMWCYSKEHPGVGNKVACAASSSGYVYEDELRFRAWNFVRDVTVYRRQWPTYTSIAFSVDSPYLDYMSATPTLVGIRRELKIAEVGSGVILSAHLYTLSQHGKVLGLSAVKIMDSPLPMKRRCCVIM
jgi:hypothetical protein